tara:strand:+ start:338 stop:463 length:126 start_codon:yes stop_codon:yes gene_type:complete
MFYGKLLIMLAAMPLELADDVIRLMAGIPYHWMTVGSLCLA